MSQRVLIKISSRYGIYRFLISLVFSRLIVVSNNLCLPSGVGTYLKDKNPKIQVVLADPQVCTYVYRASLRQPRTTPKLTSVVNVVREAVLNRCQTEEPAC